MKFEHAHIKRDSFESIEKNVDEISNFNNDKYVEKSEEITSENRSVESAHNVVNEESFASDKTDEVVDKTSSQLINDDNIENKVDEGNNVESKKSEEIRSESAHNVVEVKKSLYEEYFDHNKIYDLNEVYSQEEIENDILPFSCSGYGKNQNFVKDCTDDKFFDDFIWELIKEQNNIKIDEFGRICIEKLNNYEKSILCYIKIYLPESGDIYITKEQIIDYYKCKFLNNIDLQMYFNNLYLMLNIKHTHLVSGKIDPKIAWNIFSYLDSGDLFCFKNVGFFDSCYITNKIVNDLYVCVYYNFYKELLLKTKINNSSNNDEDNLLNKSYKIKLANNIYFFSLRDLKEFFPFFRFFLSCFNSNKLRLKNIAFHFVEYCKKLIVVNKNDDLLPSKEFFIMFNSLLYCGGYDDVYLKIPLHVYDSEYNDFIDILKGKANYGVGNGVIFWNGRVEIYIDKASINQKSLTPAPFGSHCE